MLLLVVIRGILFFQETQDRLGEEVAHVINVRFEDFGWLVWNVYDINLSIPTPTGRQRGIDVIVDDRLLTVCAHATNAEPGDTSFR